MDRVIKFRVFNHGIKTMYPVYGFNQRQIQWANEDNSLGGSFSYGKNNKKKFTIMQFTGLHDKNGKEIYYGDLVVCENAHKDYANQVLLVTFEDGAFCLRELKSTNFGKAITFRDNITNCILRTDSEPIYRIVGNRFENPELCE